MSTTICTTRTGHFPIGFRRLGLDWHKDLPGLLQWSGESNLGVIDLGGDADTILATVLERGLRIGSVDLPEMRGMLSPDAATRSKAVARNAAYIEACAAIAGPLNYFLVMLPEKPELPRAENFEFMVESYQVLQPTLEKHQGRIVIEGWPGPGALCCTTADCRAFFEKCPSPVFGLNYDPSHLLRMGIDPLRFLREFASRVHHMHGKDTELLPEALYLYGTEQPATFTKPHAFGAFHWRYTIPGHGIACWPEIFRILAEAGYKGAVSIELEDENFNGSAERQKAGILYGRDFLLGA